MAYTQRKQAGRRSFGRLLFVALTRIGLPLALFYGLLWWRIDAAIDVQLQPLRQVADVQRGDTYFSFSGEVGVQSLSLTPIGAGADGPRLRSGTLALHTPNLWWLAKAALFGPPDELPRRLTLSAENLQISGLPQRPEAGIFGALSAMPFESAGCDVAEFSRADLASMGLPPIDTRLQLDLEHSEAGIVTLSLDLATAGAGRMEGRIGLALPAGSAPRSDQLSSGRLVNLSLGFIDEGFIETRNRWCTDRVTTSLADFNRIHVDGVRAHLRSLGLQPDADLLEAYGRFARVGGQLRIETRPVNASGLRQLPTMNREALSQALSPFMRVNDSEPVRFVFVAVKPMSLREQQFALQIAKARIEDGVPLDADLAEVVSEPPRVPLPVPPRVEVPRPASDGSISYSQLGPYLGREISVTTTWGTRRRGILKEHAQAQMRLQLPISEGGFDLTVPAETVVEVRILAAVSRQPDSSTDLTDAQAN